MPAHAAVAPHHARIPAIFLAIKAEASPFLEVETLVKQLKALLDLKDEQLVENEMLLLMGNRFHITVYHPFRPLRVRLPHLCGIPSRYAQCSD